MSTKPLTAREARFVEQYHLHGNASRAAREAGYAPHQGGAIGWMLLRKPKIIAALRERGIEIVLRPKKASQFGTPVKTYRRKGLTLLQERFVHQYLIDGNATQAAIRAGLPGNPMRAGVGMTKRRAVAQAIHRERAAAAARLDITADRVKNELAAIAFANIADVADWGPDGVTLKAKTALPKADQAAIAELSSSRTEKTGAAKAHVKMHSKQRALDALARHLGLYGRGARTIARYGMADAGEKRDANAILRERLLKIAAQGKKEGTG
ncbi:MAG TPA: terminase small subunit [Stellaceae bacterium]|jgi:phage terminase small subunit|nr:terminase small subunit [Stellaceae bacterium]